MSLNINVNVNVNLPLDVVCAIRNNVNATDLEPYSDLISKTATAVMKEIKSLPYDIKPTSTTKNDAQTTTISFTVLRYNNGSRLQINDFESNTKVSRLFRRVHVDTGLPVDQTRFIFNRQQIRGYGLEDDDSNEETLGQVCIGRALTNYVMPLTCCTSLVS